MRRYGLDYSLAETYIDFIQGLLKWPNGKPCILHPWETDLVEDVFALDEHGRRPCRDTYVESAAKVGKSPICSAIGLTHLALHNPAGECQIYSAAASRDQTKHIFNPMAYMIEANEKLQQWFEVKKSIKRIEQRDDPLRRFVQSISGDAKYEDGFRADLLLIDELHRWVTDKATDLWAVCKKSQVNQAEPLRIIVTTPGATNESELCQNRHDTAAAVDEGLIERPSMVVRIFTSNPDLPWDEEGSPPDLEDDEVAADFEELGWYKAWKKHAMGWYAANPGLGRVGIDPHAYQNIEALRENAEDARLNPREINDFERFHCSRWVDALTQWLDLPRWDACLSERPLRSLEKRECYGGLDLSSTSDFTAFVLVFPIEEEDEDGDKVTHYFWLPFFWIPEGTLGEREKKDKKPFRQWAKQRLNNLTLTPGDAVDHGYVKKAIQDLGDIYRIKEIGYDPFHAPDVVQYLEGHDFTCVQVRQGFSLSPAIKKAERMIKRPPGGDVMEHDGNKTLRWMFACTSVKNDENQNTKLVKPDYRKSMKRIDGITAAMNALDRIVRHESEEVFRSRYEDDDAEVVAV